MSRAAGLMDAFFNVAVAVAVLSWVYGSRYFVSNWVRGISNKPLHDDYWDRAAIGYAIFVGCIAAIFLAGTISEAAAS